MREKISAIWNRIRCRAKTVQTFKTMARSRKNSAMNVGQLLKVMLLISLIGGGALGYVWQKNQIDKLAAQKREREKAIKMLQHDIGFLKNQRDDLEQPVKLMPRISEMQLGLMPRQESQVVRLAEPREPVTGGVAPRQFTARSANSLMP
jgi:hypothetical protein